MSIEYKQVKGPTDDLPSILDFKGEYVTGHPKVVD
jgi:hypothetical protein